MDKRNRAHYEIYFQNTPPTHKEFTEDPKEVSEAEEESEQDSEEEQSGTATLAIHSDVDTSKSSNVYSS